MRPTALAILISLAAGTGARAQEVGSRIVVVGEEARLQTQNVVVGTVRRGSVLTIRSRNGDWSWVEYAEGEKPTQGWLHRREVVPFDQAIDHFSRVVRETPSAELYSIRGLLWMERKEYDRAASDFNEALRLDPQDARALAGLPRARQGLAASAKPSGKAPARSRPPARLDPQHADVYYKRGAAWFARGDMDKALSDFNQAIRFDPQFANAYSARGAVLQNKGELEKAMADYDEAIRLDPDLADAYNNRALGWQKLTRYDRAILDWDMAIRLKPDAVPAHVGLAWLFATCPNAKLRDGQRALELATKACELSEWKSTHALAALAAAHAENGDFDNAIKWQEEFLRRCSEADQRRWGYLLDLYRSKKAYRGTRQVPQFGEICGRLLTCVA